MAGNLEALRMQEQQLRNKLQTTANEVQRKQIQQAIDNVRNQIAKAADNFKNNTTSKPHLTNIKDNLPSQNVPYSKDVANSQIQQAKSRFSDISNKMLHPQSSNVKSADSSSFVFPDNIFDISSNTPATGVADKILQTGRNQVTGQGALANPVTGISTPEKKSPNIWSNSSFMNAINSLNLNKTKTPDSEAYTEAARLSDAQSGIAAANAKTSQGIANRDERQEASKDAVSNATSKNAQTVANLGAAAGVGAAALARQTTTPDINVHRQRQDAQRAYGNQQQAVSANAARTAIFDRRDAQYSDLQEAEKKDYNSQVNDLTQGTANFNYNTPVSTQNTEPEYQSYIDTSSLPEESRKHVDAILHALDYQNYMNYYSGLPDSMYMYDVNNGTMRIVSYDDLPDTAKQNIANISNSYNSSNMTKEAIVNDVADIRAKWIKELNSLKNINSKYINTTNGHITKDPNGNGNGWIDLGDVLHSILSEAEANGRQSDITKAVNTRF